MKHIFLVHSHTLFLTALGVIEHENIKNEDVIFIFSRNYHNILPFDYECYDMSEEVEGSYYIMLSWSRRHFGVSKSQRDKIVNCFDEFIVRHAPDGYFLYVCHLQAFANQILATNPKCKNCFFIQEGGRVMRPDLTGKIKWFCRLYNYIFLHNEKRIWKMTNWFPNAQTSYNKPITAYAFDKTYFGNAPRKTIMVKWPKLKLDIDINPQYPIFLTEGAVELGQIDAPLYEKSLKKLIEEYSGDHNYIKFHPKNSAKAKSKYISYFNDLGKTVEELPMDVPFELILTNFEGLQLYGFGTSLLFYGQALGHKVVSKEEYLLSSARYRAHVKGLQTLDEVSNIKK